MGIATDAVDFDPIAASQVAYVPIAVDRREFAVARRDVRKPEDNVATRLPSDNQPSLLQGNWITPTAGIQLAKHSRGLSAILQLSETRNARFLNGSGKRMDEWSIAALPEIQFIGRLMTRQFAKLIRTPGLLPGSATYGPPILS